MRTGCAKAIRLLTALMGVLVVGLAPWTSAVAQPATPGYPPTADEARPSGPTAGDHFDNGREPSTGDAPAGSDTLSLNRDGTPARAAQEPTPEAAAASAPADTSRSRVEPGPRLTASATEGVRLVVPQAAGLTLEAHFALWARLVAGSAMKEDVDVYVEVPLARPMIVASAFDGLLRLVVQPELAGAAARLLDLAVDVAIDPAFQIRVGQFRTPVSRAFITSIVQLSMPDRGIVSDTFRADRDTGLMLFGRAGDAFEYDVGVFNGSGIDGRLGDTPAPMVVGRFVVTPFGSVPYDQVPALSVARPRGLALGVGGYFRERDIAKQGEAARIEQTANAGADVSFVEGPVAFFSEGYLQERSTDGRWIPSWGAFVQASVLIEHLIELSARGGWIDPDTESRGDVVQSYEASTKLYLRHDDVSYGHHASIALQYRFTRSREPFGALPAGNAHRVLAQLQLWM